MTDYLVLGGGLAGCVLASRLKEYLPDSSVTLVEAGPNEQDNPLLTEPMGTLQLGSTNLQHNYKTAPQRHLGNRQIHQTGGNVLSGSSSVNYAAWSRGDRADYDLWGKQVNDSRWSYEGQLPYFRKTETHFDASADPEQHGFQGPIHTTMASKRGYPLKDKIREAYLSTGIPENLDHNSGNNKGIAPHIENWRDGKRQPAAKAYGLKGVTVLVNSPVKRILFEDGPGGKKAIGAELISGQVIHTRKEVILCCGAIRSPQVLLLSGIGPAKELEKCFIPPVLENPYIGKNYHDHSAITQFFKIKSPELGLCAPSPAFNHPKFIEGFPVDYMIFATAPDAEVKKGLHTDGEDISGDHPLLHPARSHFELLPMYAPTERPLLELGIPLDGSIIAVGVINVLPTSRGTVTLESNDPLADPVIDPNYFATEFDRAVLRAAVRKNMAAFESSALEDIVLGELPPPGFSALTSTSSDDDIDARIHRAFSAFYHSAGTVSMGTAVDTECRIPGVEGLRVVDASVIPTPISAHYQVATYALAEQMAEIISGVS